MKKILTNTKSGYVHYRPQYAQNMFDYASQIKKRREFLKEIAAMDFPGAFNRFLNYVNLTPDEIEDQLGLSKRTVKRYKYSENKPSRTTLIKLLIVLSDSYEISEVLLTKAGFPLLGSSWTDVAYRTVLEQEGAITIDECNRTFAELNRDIPKKSDKIPPL